MQASMMLLALSVTHKLGAYRDHLLQSQWMSLRQIFLDPGQQSFAFASVRAVCEHARPKLLSTLIACGGVIVLIRSISCLRRCA